MPARARKKVSRTGGPARGRLSRDPRTGLNPQQDQFCDEYLVDMDAGPAYLRAYPACRSKNSAAVAACRLLSMPRIQARIAELKAKRLRRIEVKQDNVIEELRRLAFSDLRDLAEWGPGSLVLKNSVELAPEVTATVKKVRFTKEGISIELHDKLQALLKLADHLGMVTKTKIIGDADAPPVRVLVVRSLDELPDGTEPVEGNGKH